MTSRQSLVPPGWMTDAVAAALQRYSAGRPLAAALLFEGVLQHHPTDADARRLRGLSLVRAGRPLEALRDLAAARRSAPHDPLGPLHDGIGLLEAGRFARAAAMFRRAAIMSPDSEAPWVNLSTALLSLGHVKAARAAARRAIALAPEAAEPRCALGVAEIADGRMAEAEQALSEAVACNRALPDAWINLILVLVRTGQIDFAGRAVERGLRACPGNGAIEATGAGLMLLSGDQDTALARLHAIVERDPDCVAARLNLANAYLLDDGARQALDVLQGPAPGGRNGAHWRAHRSLALLLLGEEREAERELDAIPQPYGDAEILILWRRIHLARRAGHVDAAEALAVRMAALAAEEGAALFEHRVIACFDLARFRYGAGQTRDAFAHWIAGHRLLARVQPFSRESFAGFVDASVARYDAHRLRHGPRAANADPAPVFIVGMPRSGTTLTEQILAAHPLVHAAGERGAIHHLFTRLAAGGAMLASSVEVAAALDQATLTRSGEEFLERLHSLGPDARLVVDKMPANALHLGFIATLLPGAKIIHCRRDPRDIGASIFQHRFFGFHPYAHDLADLGWYIGRHDRLMAHWRAVLPLPQLVVDLADWVQDFTGTLDRVLRFLDLPPEPACERFYEQDRQVRTASSKQVRQPINARGLGRWREFADELAPMIAELEAAGLVAGEPPPAGTA